jgi:hypothetical protein
MDYYGHLGENPNADPNGDGMDNAQDAAAGLNPNIPDPIMLGYWRFNNPPIWQDEQGLSPSIALGLYPVPDWSDYAVEINAQAASVLGYPGLRPNGVPVVTCPTGSISFWFKPDWSSATATNWSGGPGDVATFFEMGRETSDASYGWFGLTIGQSGTDLNFATEANGVQTNMLQAQVQFNSHTWYQIVLTYSTQQTALYIDGQILVTNVGLAYFPSNSIVQQGFNLGCNWDGTGQANGRFDELQTFNYVLSGTQVSSNYTAAMSVLAVDGLPVIVKDGWGLRSDAFDSDCDGVPDAWKIENGFDPTVPATTNELNEYNGVDLTQAALSISNVMQGCTLSFGAFPSGIYRVDYVTGAWVNNDNLGHWGVDIVDTETSPPIYCIRPVKHAYSKDS